MKRIDDEITALRSNYDTIIEYFSTYPELQKLQVDFCIENEDSDIIVEFFKLYINDQVWEFGEELEDFESIGDTEILDESEITNLEFLLITLVNITYDIGDHDSITFTREGVEEYLKNKKL